MATLITNPFPFKAANDVDFRAWLAHLVEVLVTVNPDILTRAPDTGQMDLATVAMPTSSGMVPGFLIFKFDDAIGSPLFLKLTLRRANSSDFKTDMLIEVGTATNGAGAFVGFSYVFNMLSGGNSSQWAAHQGSFPSLASCSPGNLSVVIGQLSDESVAYSGARLNFHLSRFCDEAGDPLPGVSGVLMIGSAASPNAAGVMTATVSLRDQAAVTVSGGATVQAYQAPPYGNSVSGYSYAGFTQPGAVFYLDPTPKVSAGACVLQRTDVAINTELQVALVGLEKRNYRAIGPYFINSAPGGYTRYCFRWE